MNSFRWGLLSILIIGLLWMHKFLLNLDKPLNLAGVDPSLASFILKHYMTVIFSGNWGEMATLPMFYGLPNSLFLTDHHAIFAFFALPIFAVTGNIIFSTNLLSVAAILFSLTTTYLFSFYITKKVLSSILAGVIFALNPYIASHFPDHLILITAGWIPLIFLFFEKSLENPSRRNIFLLFLLLSCQLLSSLYYSAFLTAILPFYFVIRIFQKKINLKKWLNQGFFVGISLFSLIAFGSALFYLNAFNNLDKFTYDNSTSLSIPPVRNQAVTTSYSPEIGDLFFDPVEKNIVQSLIFKQSQAPRPTRQHINEKTIFIGFIPLVFFLLSFFLLKFKGPLRTFALLTIFAALLSLGPVIKLSHQINLPGPYRYISSVNPLFEYMRAPGRIAVFTFFFFGSQFVTRICQATKKTGKQKRRHSQHAHYCVSFC